MTSPELELLKDAFIWEQQQMQAWMNQMNDPGSDVKPNAMKKLLSDAWVKYFQKLTGSNQGVIDICNKASNGLLEVDNAKNAIITAIGGNDEYDDVSAGIKAFL
jgi:hypothetical protein